VEWACVEKENATGDGQNGNHPRRTAYKYDDKGRLTVMAAVLPNHAFLEGGARSAGRQPTACSR
jgi:hypothetical protein